jgi:hypothetical protein
VRPLVPDRLAGMKEPSHGGADAADESKLRHGIAESLVFYLEFLL